MGVLPLRLLASSKIQDFHTQERTRSMTDLQSSADLPIPHPFGTITGTLYTRHGNALSKLTSLISDFKTPPSGWSEKDFTLDEQGVLSYARISSGRAMLYVCDTELVVRSSRSNKEDQAQNSAAGDKGSLTISSLLDMAPIPNMTDKPPTQWTFSLRAEQTWFLCAKNEADMVKWTRAFSYYIYHAEGRRHTTASFDAMEYEELTHTKRSENNFEKDSKQLPFGKVNIQAFVTAHADVRASAIVQKARNLVNRIRILEGFAGLGVLNFLLVLILNSSPNLLESWLFVGSVNLLVCWGILVRMEQIMFDMDLNGTKMNSVNQKSMFEEDSDGDGEEESNSPNEGAETQELSSSSDVAPHRVGTPELDSMMGGSLTKSMSRRKLFYAMTGQMKRAPGPFPPHGDFDSADPLHIKHPVHTYAPIDASRLSVRVGPNYKREGKKAPSSRSLFRLVGCDLFNSEKKIDLIADKINMPDPSSGRVRPPGLPQFLVVNYQLQRAGTNAFFSNASSPGYSLACYFEPSASFLAEIESGTLSPAAALAMRFFANCTTDDSYRDKLKLIAMLLNPATCDIPSWAMMYNGKPVMMKESNTISRLQAKTSSGAICDVVEFDVDFRKWGLLFRQGVSTILPMISKLDFVLALVIEADEDENLPERVLCGARVNFMDLKSAHPMAF